MLQTNQLTYQYPNAEALHFPDIHCASGDHFLLIGQSGSGKTTLLHLLGGLLTPSNGTVKIADTVISNLSGTKLDQFRGQHIGIVFQKSHFVASLTVEENLLLAQSLAGLPSDKTRVQELLSELSIAHKTDSKINALSVGEQQRVAIARALVNRPTIILADEPTSALDDANSSRVISLLEEQAKAVNATLMIVTHDNRLKDHFSNQLVLAPQNIAL